MQYPSSIKFVQTSGGLNVGYSKKSNYNLDVWAISYLLNENRFKTNTVNIIDLDLRDATMALRSYFLPKIIRNIEFSLDVTTRAASIIECIDKGEYITYPRDYKFKERGTKAAKESKIEKRIFENLSKYFKGEFNNEKRGIRQFPANIFHSDVNERNRISRKFWIDILTVNKNNQLSVLELKVSLNAPLVCLYKQSITEYFVICLRNR